MIIKLNELQFITPDFIDEYNKLANNEFTLDCITVVNILDGDIKTVDIPVNIEDLQDRKIDGLDNQQIFFELIAKHFNNTNVTIADVYIEQRLPNEDFIPMKKITIYYTVN